MENTLRYEQKYLLSSIETNSLMEYLKTDFILDKNCTVNEGYRVHTVYFDDKQMTSYHEKFNGEEEKTKYRLRSYGNHGHTRAEVKKKRGEISQKWVFPFEKKLDETLLNLGTYKDKFSTTLRVKQLKPVVYISYLRRAFNLKVDPSVRVTFDSNLTYQILDSRGLREQMLTYPSHKIICEVKYYKLDSRVLNILAPLEKKRVSFSKYFNVLDYNYYKRRDGFI